MQTIQFCFNPVQLDVKIYTKQLFSRKGLLMVDHSKINETEKIR